MSVNIVIVSCRTNKNFYVILFKPKTALSQCFVSAYFYADPDPRKNRYADPDPGGRLMFLIQNFRKKVLSKIT